jgi:aspartyl-tRNA(Asn)/glutamyl-tRNA(Gln) amidotransferase subunit A
MGFSGGLPLSLQLVGPALEDARVLAAAAAFQARTGHHRARPELAPAGAPVARAGRAVTGG